MKYSKLKRILPCAAVLTFTLLTACTSRSDAPEISAVLPETTPVTFTETAPKETAVTAAAPSEPQIYGQTADVPDNIKITDGYILTYYFTDGETVDLSSIKPNGADSQDIRRIHFAPETPGNTLGGIKAFSDDQDTGNIGEIIIENYNIPDYGFLKSFGALNSVSFYSCDVKNAFVIGEIKTLSSLSLTDSTIDDISFLGSLPALRDIYFENTPVPEIPALYPVYDPSDMEDSFSFSFINCGNVDLGFIRRISDPGAGIYQLDLTGSTIEDLSPLSSIYISRLILSGTDSSFDTMQGLEAGTVWLDGCGLSDISFLSGSRIDTLFLEENNISDWSPLLDVEGLRWCWTFDNPVIMPDNIEEFEEKEITLADTDDRNYPYV